MQIDIEATNLELTAPLRAYVEEKIGKLEKFLGPFKGSDLRVRVEVGRTSKHHRQGNVYRAEANLYLPGKMLRAETKAEDVRMAVNEVRNTLQREIRKYKTSL